MIVRNVLADPEAFQLRLPTIDVAVWTPTQLGHYLDVAMTHRLGLALWMATFTGARRGEVVGMQWRDLDLEAGEWHIKRAMLITGEGTPKSKAGNRIIGRWGQIKLTFPVTDPDAVTIGMLTKWRSQQREELLSVGINPTQHDDLAVFNSPGKASSVHPDTMSKLHVKTVKQAELPWMKMHGLRHAHATYLIASGESIKAVSDRLGHATPSFTLSVYAQSLPSERRAVATRFAEIIGDAHTG